MCIRFFHFFLQFYLNSHKLLDSRLFLVSHGKSKVPFGSEKYKEQTLNTHVY